MDTQSQFSPPWLFRNGHVQTLAGLYLFRNVDGKKGLSKTRRVAGQVALADGDQLVYQDDCPDDWQPGGPVAVLLHGLGGSHSSPYMVRVASRLNKEKIRTIRLDWRGCGAGAGLARYPYHSGRSDDVASLLNELDRQMPGTPVTLIGFSLGGNVALKFLGEQHRDRKSLDMVQRAVAVCPPIDLHFSVVAMQRGLAKVYDQYFCRSCTRDIHERVKRRADTVVPDGWFAKPPRTLYEFDETFTAPVSGFASAADYYAKSNSQQYLEGISVPTLIIAAQDDPLIPIAQFQKAAYSSTCRVVMPRHGGHLGFCTLRGQHWLDDQITDWIHRSER
ncbi:YheT family hydrolase [Planctomicrobium sp. SH668]|uniref:YheT family hydrolase n=1 Tax=Planctomicrobium sp. SH668 TaxID=3448126 RepID=UPI003F5BCFF7